MQSDSAAPRQRHRLRTRALVATTIALICLALGEMAGRIYARSTLQARGVGYSETLGWRLLPDIEKVGEMWCDKVPAKTNSHGWRDVECDYKRTPGRARIVALGDSFTFGHGVDYGERFTERLEDQLADTEVVNMGVCAYGTDQELLAWESEGQRYSPDVVLLTVFLGNDLADIRLEYSSGWSKPYFLLHDDELELVKPHKSLAVTIRTSSYLAEWISQRLTSNSPRQRQAQAWESGDPLPLFSALVKRLEARVEAQGAKLLVLIVHDNRGRGVPPPKHHQRAVADLRARGMHVVDCHSLFQTSEIDHAELYLSDGAHWSPAGHALVSKLIAEDLRARDWL